MLVPVGFTLVAQSARPLRVGRALAVVGVPILLGPIFGPITGGLIVDSTAWQWIFVVNLPIAVVAIGLAARLLGASAGRANAGALGPIVAGLVLMGLFAWHSLRVARPLIDTRLFGSRELHAASTTTFVLGAAALLPGVALVRADRVERPTTTPAAVQSARSTG